jgi:hypothetical protein
VSAGDQVDLEGRLRRLDVGLEPARDAVGIDALDARTPLALSGYP